MLQIGRSRIRDQIKRTNFSICLILLVSLGPEFTHPVPEAEDV
jgi:hypothetical protein